jgi:hypothetical protein
MCDEDAAYDGLRSVIRAAERQPYTTVLDVFKRCLAGDGGVVDWRAVRRAERMRSPDGSLGDGWRYDAVASRVDASRFPVWNRDAERVWARSGDGVTPSAIVPMSR